jgi:cysteine-rich repeat protein
MRYQTTFSLCALAFASLGAGCFFLVPGLPGDLVCGDGLVASPETCDDANNADNDGCSASCQVECGDGILNALEECDDGNTTSNDGCDQNCFIEGAVLEAEPNDDGQPNTNGGLFSGFQGDDFDPNTAQGPFSGSVVILGALDPIGDEDGFSLLNTRANPVEIDAFITDVDGDENCDAEDLILNVRNTNNNNNVIDQSNVFFGGCAQVRVLLNPDQGRFVTVIAKSDQATASYTLALDFADVICGDGLENGNEECDDGNLTNGDGCESNCQDTCGNGQINESNNEECDDGNGNNADGCSAGCQLQPGFVCSGEPTDCNPICGDGLLVSGEQCDDGNLLNGDGCSAVCLTE